MATIKDIARIANVSPSTVSFVLNGKAREMKVSSGHGTAHPGDRGGHRLPPQ